MVGGAWIGSRQHRKLAKPQWPVADTPTAVQPFAGRFQPQFSMVSTILRVRNNSAQRISTSCASSVSCKIDSIRKGILHGPTTAQADRRAARKVFDRLEQDTPHPLKGVTWTLAHWPPWYPALRRGLCLFLLSGPQQRTMRAAAPAALTSGRLSLSLLVASLGFLLVAQGQEANPDALIPTCPPSAVTIPKEYQGAGDPAAGSPFADNLIETLTERSWSSYLMGAVVLTRCLVNYYKAENDPSHMIFDFGSKTDTIYSCARASLNLERKQLQYNTSDFSRGCPTTINKSQPPALSFGSIMGREGCPQLPLDTVPPIPDLYRMPYREYGPGELDAANPGGTAAVGVSPAPANGVGGLGQASAFPQGAAFVIDGYRFILRMAPHFIVHFCTREATLFPLPEGSDPSFAHKLVAGREGFNVACVILARRGFDLIFTQPKVTTSLNSGEC